MPRTDARERVRCRRTWLGHERAVNDLGDEVLGCGEQIVDRWRGASRDHP